MEQASGTTGFRDKPPDALSASCDFLFCTGHPLSYWRPISPDSSSGFPSHIFATQEWLSSSLVSSEDLREKTMSCPKPGAELEGGWYAPAEISQTEKELSSQKMGTLLKKVTDQRCPPERKLKEAFSCGTWGDPGHRHGCFRAWVIENAANTALEKILALLLARIMRPQGHLILPRSCHSGITRGGGCRPRGRDIDKRATLRGLGQWVPARRPKWRSLAGAHTRFPWHSQAQLKRL